MIAGLANFVKRKNERARSRTRSKSRKRGNVLPDCNRNERRKSVRNGGSVNLLKDLWTNITNWVEVYFWVPVSFLSIYFLSLSAYWLSGREPRMNLDWMPELGVNLFKCICAIVLTSIAKESLWSWLSVKDKLEAPVFALGRMVFEVITLMAFLWVLFNR